MLINIIRAIVLGIIEGITEFLPIFSTGYLYLANYVVKLQENQSFIDMFMVVIQLGAILSIIVIYFNKLNPFLLSKTELQRENAWPLWLKVIVAVLPSVIIGLPLGDWLDEHMTNWQVINATLIIYGVLFILLENYYRDRNVELTDLSKVSLRMAFLIGCFQVPSLIPGTSCSGATILGAILLGASRCVSAELSFFLAIPTMFSALLLRIVKYVHAGYTFVGDQLTVLLVSMIVSFVVAYLAVKFLLKFIQTHDFKPFGWYKIALGIIAIIIGVFVK